MIDFIIIGAQKSASTFVHRLIEQSDEVYMPRGEVRSFEDPHFQSGGPEKLKSICETGQGKKIGIKRPGYLGREEVPERIHASNKDAKLILVLRDPVERFRSAYYHYVKLGFAPVEDINIAIPQIIDGAYQKKHKKLWELLPYGKYHECLERYRQYFDRDSILIIESSELKDRENLVSKLENFLGITISSQADVSFWSANQGVYNTQRLKFLRLRNRLCYSYNSDNTSRWRRKNPVSTFINSAFYVLDRVLLVHIFGNEKPALSDANRTLLSDYYRPDQEQLGKEYLQHAS